MLKEADTSCNPVRGRILIVRRSSSSIHFNECSEMLVFRSEEITCASRKKKTFRYRDKSGLNT